MNENKLSTQSSPYLLQHKNNPVNWYPWGEEAFDLSKSLQKPILLSIGYASCHWCHVMAHESFEDLETAELMNDLFVNIKVDREERPDVDEIYLQAVQLISGHGGWPLTVFLTPELKPFFGGTYFPLEANYGQPSFKDVLLSVSNYFKKNKIEAVTKSEQIQGYLNAICIESSKLKCEEILKDKSLTVTKIVQELLPHYKELLKKLELDMDKKYGGFGHAPKFPQPSKLSAFLFSENKIYSQHALFSLIQICSGGITDQIGGGISRYSVDEKWLIPHFEKMLYDNAQIIPLLSFASLLEEHNNKSNFHFFRSYAIKNLNYIERDLKSLNYLLYYSSEDADSEGEEGLFYTFFHEEFSEIFSSDPKLLEFSQRFFNVTIHGNFEGTNILTSPWNLELFCKKYDYSIEDVNKMKDTIHEKLFYYRLKRVRPALDDKFILSWNALLAKGMLQSAVYLNDRSLFKNGLDLVRNCLEKFKINGKIIHCLSGRNDAKNSLDQIPISAFADDVAFLLEACCEAFVLTGCEALWSEITFLVQYIYDHFCDFKLGLFYYTEDDKKLINRPVKNEDNVIYSANSAIMNSYVKINSLKKVNPSFFKEVEKNYKIMEEVTLLALSNAAVLASKIPISSARILQIASEFDCGKVLFINNKNEQTDFDQISHAVNNYFKSNAVGAVFCCSVNSKYTLEELYKYSIVYHNKNTDYVYCDKTGCQLPVKNVSDLFQRT